MLIKNNKNIKYYKFIFVIVTFIFSVLFFCLCNSTTVNATEVTSTEGMQIAEWDSEKGKFKTDNYGDYIYGSKVTNLSLRYEITSTNAICRGFSVYPGNGWLAQGLKVKIPDKINGKTVIIGDNAFKGVNNVYEFDLSNIETLGKSSFKDCEMRVLKLSLATKEIPDSCFENCSALQYLNIPCSVTTIGYDAFYNNGAHVINIGWDSNSDYNVYSNLSEIKFRASSGGSISTNPLWGYRTERITVNNSLNGRHDDTFFAKGVTKNTQKSYGWTGKYRVYKNVLYETTSSGKLNKILLYPIYHYTTELTAAASLYYVSSPNEEYSYNKYKILGLANSSGGKDLAKKEVVLLDYVGANGSQDFCYASYWYLPSGKANIWSNYKRQDFYVRKRTSNGSSTECIKLPAYSFWGEEVGEDNPFGSFTVYPNITEICDNCFKGVAFLSEVRIPITIKRIGEFAFYYSSNNTLSRKYFLEKITFYYVKNGKENDYKVTYDDNGKPKWGLLHEALLRQISNENLEVSGSNGMAMDINDNGGLSGTYKANTFFQDVLSLVVEKYYKDQFNFNLKTVTNAYDFNSFLALVKQNYDSNTQNYGKDVKQPINDVLNRYLGLYKWSAWTNAEQTEAITEIDTSFLTEDKPRKYFIVYDNSGSMGAYPGSNQPFTKNLITHALVKHLSDEILSANSENKLGITAAWREYDPEIDNSIYKADTNKGLNVGSKDNPYLYAWRKIAKTNEISSKKDDDGFISATSAGTANNAKSAVSQYLNHIVGEKFSDTNYYTPLRDVAKLIGSKGAGEAAPVVIFIADGSTTNFGCFSSDINSYVEDKTANKTIITKWKKGSTTKNDWFDGATPLVEGHAWTRFSESGADGSFTHAKEELEHLRNDYFVANGIQARSIVVGTNDSNNTLKNFVGGDPNYCAEIADMTDFTKKINSIVSTTSGTVVLRDVINTNNFKIQTTLDSKGNIVPDIEFLIGGTNSKYDGVAATDAPGAPASLKINSDFDVEGNGWKLVSDGNFNYMNNVTFDSENYTNKTISEIKQAIRDGLEAQNKTEAEILSAIQQEIEKIKVVHVPYKYNNNTNRVNRIRIRTILTDNTKTGTSIETNALYHVSDIAGDKNTSLTFADGAANAGEENYVKSPTLKRYGLTIQKTDVNRRKLENAEFNIKNSSGTTLKFKKVDNYYIYTEDAADYTTKLITDSDGQIKVYALPIVTPANQDRTSETFTITETAAPSGYAKASAQKVTIGNDSTSMKTISFKDDFAYKSLTLDKCFEVGNLSESEILAKAKTITLNISGNRQGDGASISKNYNVADTLELQDIQPAIDGRNYAWFEGDVSLPVGTYNVSETINSNSFFDKTKAYMVETNHMSSVTDIVKNILSDISDGKTSNNIDITLTPSTSSRVFVFNGLKTTDLTIDKTTNCTNNYDYFNGYSFEIEGTDLLKQKFIWRIDSSGSVKKYFVDASGKEKEIKNQPQIEPFTYTLDAKVSNVIGMVYSLENIPYSANGYTVKEIISSNNFDASQTKVYDSEDDFYHDTNGRVRLSTKASASNGFYAGFRNIPVGSIKVTKTAEDNFVKGLEFTVKEVGNTSKLYTATTNSSGIATFNNLPVFDVNGKKIEYEIKENTPLRYDTVVYKKGTETLSENENDYYAIGSLTVGNTVEISVENRLKEGTINIRKYYNGRRDDSERSNYCNIPFTITQYSASGTKIKDYSVVTNSLGNASITVPIYGRSNSLYRYKVVENQATAKKYSNVIYSFDDSFSDSNASGKFYLTTNVREKTIYVNNIMNGTLAIEKKDADNGNLLAGAEFKICRKGSAAALSFDYDSKNASYNYNSNGASTVVTSSASAPILVCGLAEGEYEITETKAPNNYEITEKAPKSVEIKKNEKNNVVGASVTFYDRLKTREIKIYKFAEDCIHVPNLTTLQARISELKETKFKISGKDINDSEYEKIVEMNDASRTTMYVDNSSGGHTAVYGIELSVSVPYGLYDITEIEAANKYNLNSVISKVLTSTSLTESDFKTFLESEPSNVLRDITIYGNVGGNNKYVFYNQLKRSPVNVYKVVQAESLEDALAIVDGTKFRTYGGISHTTPTITTSVNGIIELNTANGWTQVDNKIAGLGSSVYCFKYTIDNVAVGTETTIREFPGKNCDNTLVSASKLPNASSAEKLYDSSSSMLKTFTLGDVKIGTNRNAYFFNYPKRAPLIIAKSANMFTAPDNLPAKITKEIILDSLNGIEFRISGTTYWGKEINLDIPIDNSWKVASNPNSKCYYMYTSVSDNLGKDLPLGNYTIKEVLPTNSEFVASKTMSKLYDVDPSKNPEALYENVKNDYTVSSSVSCNTTTGTKTASFYNVKDYVKLTLKKYSNVWSDFNGLDPKDCLIKLLDGTRFLISGKTEAGQEYSKEIIINEENKDLFEATYEGQWYLYYTMNIPRGNYTVKEVESPYYNLSETTSKFENLNNHASYTSSASLQINLLNIANQNSSNFVCAFHNKAATTDLTIYKILDYNGFDYSTPLTPEEKQGIKDLFKDLKFTISCETFYGTDIKTLETNNQDDWKVDCYQGRPYIYQTVSVPIGKCTITETTTKTAADGTNTHNYFDLSKTSVAKTLSKAIHPTSYAKSITETYTKNTRSSRVCFANRLKTKQIKVALFGEGANSITSAKELLNNTQFEIKANSTISGVPYSTRKITFNKNNLSDTLIADTDNIKPESYPNNSPTHVGFAYAEITVPEGNYSVTELSSNDIYDLSKTSYSWNAENAIIGKTVGQTYKKDVSSAANATAETFNFYFYNRYALGDIVVNKIDSETEAPIKGVEFELRDKNYKVLKFKEDTKSTADKPVYVLDETSGSSTLKTGNEGNFTVKDMPYGSYYLFETKSTEDYVTDENSAFISLTSPKVTKTIENTLKQKTLRIVKAAEDIDENTYDINTVLKGLVFTIQGTKKNGEEYEKSITIDDNTSLTKSSINESSYVYFDVTVPVGQYTVSENTSNVKKYASGKICVADSVEKIIDKNSRTLGNSIDVTVNAINTNTEEDSNNSEVAATACFYNPLNYVKLQLYKYVPNVANMDKLKSLLSGTKFIIEGKNGSSYYQEYIIDKDNFIWVPADSKAMDGVSYKGYMLASYIVLPVGTYDVREIPNDNFDASKTRVGYALSHALANAPRTSFEITMTKTDTTYNRTFVNYPTTKTIRLAKVANNTFDSVANSNVRKYLEGIEFKFEDIIFGNNGYNETVTIDSSWAIGTSNGYKYLYKDIEVPVSSYTITETFGSNIYYDAELSETHYANTLTDVLDVSKRENGRAATLNVAGGIEELYFFNSAKSPQYVIYKAIKGNISKAKMLELVKGTKFVVTSDNNSDPNFKSFTITVGENAYNTADEYGVKWGYSQKISSSDKELYSYISYSFSLSFGQYTIQEIPNDNFDASKIYSSTTLDSAVKNMLAGNASASHSQLVYRPYASQSPSIHASMFINTLANKNVRIYKFADNVTTRLSDKQVHTYLNGIEFNIKDTLFGEDNYNETVTIDDTWSVGISGDYKYLYKDFELPVSEYSVTESIDLTKNIYYDPNGIYVATSIEDIVASDKRTKGSSNEVSLINVKKADAFFYNTQKSEGLSLQKYVPGITTAESMFNFVNGTKFVITGITNPSFKQEIVVSASTKNDWVYFPTTSSKTNISYYGMKLKTPVKLPTGRYNVEEVPNDNTDVSKTRVGWNLVNAELDSSIRTSYPVTISAKQTNTAASYARCFINYPATKTIRLAKVANNTFDSVTDANVRKYLKGLEFKFEDQIFGEAGYNETITIDSSWTIGKSNGYKYLYKDIDVLASNYTVTESVGENIYYNSGLSETYYQNTLEDVLDTSKRINGSSATFNVAEDVDELYFFNTAKPTKLVLSKAVEEDIPYSSLFKLVAGTKFILTNKTTGSVTTVVVPDKASSEPDELGGKWSAWHPTVSDKTYTRLQYTIYGLDPGNYAIKEIPNENFAPSGIYTSDSLSNAIKNKTNNNPSDTYSFAMSKPFIDSDATTSYVTFLNTFATKTIRISKVANNTFANLQNSTILGYLKGLQFDINNTLISDEKFSKIVTIDNTWSVATSGNYKYAYKDIEVPAGIYTVEESIGSNTTFDAELTETYYQTSVENVLDAAKRQQGTLGAVTTSDGSNEICFFNTVGPVKLVIYKAVQGSLSKTAMVDLVKGTKFEIKNNITNDLTTITVGENACVTADEYGRKWGYFTKTGSDDNIYTLLQYVIEGFDPGQYNIKEIPNDNFVQSEIRVNTSLAVTIGSQPKDNINFTAHKPNTMSNATYSNLFLNTLETKTMRIVKLADNIYDTTTDANVRAYLNGLQFTITDNYFKDDGYSDTLTIDNTWSIAKDANNKVKYVYKDVKVPVSSYSIEETAGTNTMYDLTKTYNQKTLSDVLDTEKRILSTKTTVNLANNEKDVYFYNSAKPGKFVLSKLVEGVKDETELRRLVNGTKFVLTNDRTAESVTYTIDSSWLFRTRSSSTGIVYGELYKTLNLDANKYTLKEVVNGNFEQDKIRIDWSVDKAEASEYRDTTTFTIVDPTKTLARLFINTPKTATIKLAKLADVTSSKISDDAVYKVLNGLDINVKSLNFNETYTIDNTWKLSSGNGYKYLYKEITVPYGAYTITETTGTNTNFDMSNVYNSEALAKVVDATQRSKGSSFKLVVDSASEKAYIFNTAKLVTTRLVKIMDETTSAYIHKVADGTKFIVTGTDFVGRSVNKTFTVDSSWKYSTATYNSQKYSYLYLDVKVLPGSYTIAETTNANCDSSKVTTGAGLQAAIKSTTPSTTIKLTATSTDAIYWRVFYNHLKETTLYLSKIGENINSEASYSETHKFLDGLQFKVSGHTALGEVYDKTFTINSDWYIGKAGKYRKLTYNLSLPYGSYTFTELSGSNNKYDLSKTKFAYNSTDILNEAVRKTGTSTSITISSTTSYGLVFLNVLKEKPEYSISNTTASTPDSSLTGTIETHVVNGAEESYNDGTDVPVVVIIKDKDGNKEIIATEKVDLKAGEEKDLTFSVIYPNDIKPEEYEIEVRINWDDKDKEQDPTNNTDSTVINPYDFAINKVGLKENEASVGGYIKLVPEITYSGSKPFTDNNATLQFYVIDSSGNQVGDILSEIKLNSIEDLVDSNGNLNVSPNSTWVIGSNDAPLSFLLPDNLVAGQTYQIRARVNWDNRFKELNPNNNEKEEGFSAVTKIDVKIKPNYPNSSYYAGTEVISTFTVDNVANSFNIIPKYLNVKFSVTALLPSGTIKDVPVDGDKLSIEKESIVPKRSTGIVYFKWKIPEKLSDGTSLIGATLNCKALLVANGYKDADPSNDTAVLSKKLYELPKSSVADTNYEENSKAAMDALKADHSAEGIKITNFVNKAISAMEHFDKVTTNKTEDSKEFQYKSLSSWEEWSYKGGKFIKNYYSAKLNNFVVLKADENHMVDGSTNDLTKFKSGYGFTVNAKANATKASARSLPKNSYTNAQYSACFFPEYLFSDKKNEYETLIYNTTKKAFEIVNEKYSNNLHYTPIWYPDITTNTGNYPVAVEFTQCWTPAGVISSKKTNNLIKISGNIYEDWYQQQH